VCNNSGELTYKYPKLYSISQDFSESLHPRYPRRIKCSTRCLLAASVRYAACRLHIRWSTTGDWTYLRQDVLWSRELGSLVAWFITFLVISRKVWIDTQCSASAANATIYFWEVKDVVCFVHDPPATAMTRRNLSKLIPKIEMGQWVMGHCQRPIDPWWWNNCAVVCNFLFLLDIKKPITHSIRPIIMAGGSIVIYDFCPQDREGCPVPPCHVPPSPTTMGRIKRCNDYGSWVTKDDPFPSSTHTANGSTYVKLSRSGHIALAAFGIESYGWVQDKSLCPPLRR